MLKQFIIKKYNNDNDTVHTVQFSDQLKQKSINAH